MATKRLQGFLRDPLSEFAQHDLWRFTHLTTTGEVVKGSQSLRRIGADGSYDFLLRYGRVLIESKDRLSQRWVLHGEYTINAQTAATTIPALLLATTPTTPEVIQQLESLLADAEGARDETVSLFESAGTAVSRDAMTSFTDMTTQGALMPRGAFGHGFSINSNLPYLSDYNHQESIINGAAYATNNATSGTDKPFGGDACVVRMERYGQNDGAMFAWRGLRNPNGGLAFRTWSTINGFEPWSTIYHTSNTTIDSNGFIKSASPIIKLHNDKIDKNGDFNAEFERADIGHYVIKSTMGFAKTGWYIETPRDANGNVKIFVDYEYKNGDIIIKTYKPDYSKGFVSAGAPTDIPDGRWIDIRLHEAQPPERQSDQALVVD